MSMLLSALTATLKASLMGAKEVFEAADDADFKRHLHAAAQDLGRYVKRRRQGSITLIAGQTAYDVPVDLISMGVSSWGDSLRNTTQPWDDNWPGIHPTVRVISGTPKQLEINPAPTAAQITQCGSDFPFTYYATHIVSEDDGATTVPEEARALLILRAQAEAMKELSFRNSTKPVKIGGGIAGGSKNGTPAALYQQLMESFETLGAAWR